MEPAETVDAPGTDTETDTAPPRRTYVLVDGENIDATLGTSVLQRRPAAEERPRWERVTKYAEAQWGQPVTGLFFLNATSGHLPAGFVQALLALDYRPVPLSGRADEKVVDIGIQRTLDALLPRDADVFLVSHDGDFLPQMTALLGGDRRLGVLGFREFVNAQYPGSGIEVHDLEDDVKAFKVPLPRVRIIDLVDFDPDYFLR